MKLKGVSFSVRQLRLLLLALLAAAALVFVIVSVLGLDALSSKSSELVGLKLKSASLDAQLINLRIAKKEVEQYSYFNEVSKTVLPADKDQAKAVLTIFKLAEESGIGIASITFPDSNLGSRSATAAGSVAAAISQARPVVGIKGLYSLQLTIKPEVGPNVPDDKVISFSKMIDFLQRIERNRRTAQITQIDITPVSVGEDTSESIEFSLKINIFLRPDK